MQIFGFPLSPFVRKVLVAAAEKGIAVDNVHFHPRQPPPEFLAASPFRKIPALRDGDYTLADSTAIITYFEAKHPDPPLLPAEAKARGKAIWFEEFADTIATPAGAKIMFNRFVAPKLLGMPGDEAKAREGEEELRPILAYLEREAPADGWLAGETFSVGDIAVASVLTSLGYVGLSPDPATQPATSAWLQRVRDRPAWREVAGREQAALAAQMGARS
ncbi:MAG: glutathione S-transferase family protein [Novosphingobium sp.]